jgi:hypothetical protein
MKMYRWLNACVAASMLVACGGGGGSAGTAPFGDGTASSTAADLVLVVEKPTLSNTGSQTVNVTTTVLDGARNTLPGAKVVVTADSDAIVTTPTAQSGADGTVASTVGIGANRANRVITVQATAGTIVKTATIQVIGSTLSSTVTPAVVRPGNSGSITFKLVDAAKEAMANQDIEVIAVGLTPSSAKGRTDISGRFEFAYTAPTSPGTFKVLATAGGATLDPAADVSVLQADTVGPASGAVTSASVSANPSVVAFNEAGSKNNRAEIRALFLGANNVPIKNVRVRFDLDQDTNNIGGTFEPTVIDPQTGKVSPLFSDANGVVTTSYIPGSRSSPTGGVTVRACYGPTETDPGYDLCTTFAKVNLTVAAEPLGVSIGTNEFVIVDELTYTKKFLVTVVDSAGVAKPDINITASVDLKNYRKGEYGFFAGLTPPSWAKTSPIDTICLNEDLNRNGVAEAGEDLDADARLEPGKSDVAISILQSKTRADGTAEIQVRYAKSFATWIDAEITVAASGISGTEGRAKYLLSPIPAPAEALRNRDAEPAFAVSPYGVAPSCSDKN